MSDIDPLEREKNLLRLAEEGCVVAVVENEQTNQEHCVEVYQRQDGIWHSRIKTFNLQKQNVGNYPSMDPFPSIAILSRIGHEVRGRWLGIFKSMSAPERSAWVREKQDRRKRCREAISGSMRRSLNGLKDAIQEFIRERDLPAQVWRGHLDDLRVKVEGYETLEVMAAIQCGSLQTWVQTPDVIRFAYCSCLMNKKGIAEVVLFFSVSWREKQRISIFPFAQNGTRYFALLGRSKPGDEKYFYPFLCKDGCYRERFCLTEYQLNDPDTDLHDDHQNVRHHFDSGLERSVAYRSDMEPDDSEVLLDSIALAVDQSVEGRNVFERATAADTRMNKENQDRTSVVDLKTWLAS